MMGPRHETTIVSTTDGLVSVHILLGPRSHLLFWEQNDCVTNARAPLLALIHPTSKGA